MRLRAVRIRESGFDCDAGDHPALSLKGAELRLARLGLSSRGNARADHRIAVDSAELSRRSQTESNLRRTRLNTAALRLKYSRPRWLLDS